MTTARHQAREIAQRESSEFQRRLRDAELCAALEFRDVPGIAPVAPAELQSLFRTEACRAWAILSDMSEAQLLCQAIEQAVYLGEKYPWYSILEYWQTRLAQISRQQELSQGGRNG